MYNIARNISYNDNFSYRSCLREITNMDKSAIYVPWDRMDDDLDDETKDEMLFDSAKMTTFMDYIYDKTCKVSKFDELYVLAAGKMFSTDQNIGLAILFSYDYFIDFHKCLVDFFDKNDIDTINFENLKNKLC